MFRSNKYKTKDMPIEKIEEGSQSVPYSTQTGEDVIIPQQQTKNADRQLSYDKGYADGYAKGFDDGTKSSSETPRRFEDLSLWKVECYGVECLVVAKNVADAISKYVEKHKDDPKTESRINGVTKMDSVIY